MKIIKTLLLSLIFLTIIIQSKAQQGTAAVAVNKVYTNYIAVKNALTTDNVAKTQSAAKELLDAISAVPADQLSADQKAVWTANQEQLAFDSRHISESTEIDHQRMHFVSLSKNIGIVIKGLKLNTTALYEEYCPMKKVTWISETNTIKNPYFGKQMPTCGNTTATLTAVKNN